MRKELEWIRRQPKARGTKAKYRVEAFEDLKEKASQKRVESKVEINVGMVRSGKKIIEVNHLNKAFGNQTIIKDFSYTFKRQDRIGIVGKNGVGKSTFLEMLVGRIQADSGTIDKGENTAVGYYTQKEIQLPEDKRVIDVVKDIAEVMQTGTGEAITASQLLTHFLFPPKQQYSYVSTLSGGEKRRLQLLQILVKNPNFLILDEPTNDLDIATLNVLEEFLADYQGCIILVSHDRYFMDRLVEHLFVFEGEGIVRDFAGNYSDYREDLKEREAEEAEKQKQTAKNISIPPKEKETKTTTKTKLSYKEKQEYERLEKEIADLETLKEKFLEKLNIGKGTHQELLEWSREIERITQDIDTKTNRWIELAELI
jgi:ATP-binding cassette subfamily F protein uup